MYMTNKPSEMLMFICPQKDVKQCCAPQTLIVVLVLVINEYNLG